MLIREQDLGLCRCCPQRYSCNKNNAKTCNIIHMGLNGLSGYQGTGVSEANNIANLTGKNL